MAASPHPLLSDASPTTSQPTCYILDHLPLIEPPQTKKGYSHNT